MPKHCWLILVLLSTLTYVCYAGKRGVIRIGYLTGSQNPPPGSRQRIYYRKPGQAISGAITLAINEVNADPTVLPNHDLEFGIAETYGQELSSVRQTSLLASSSNISVIIGPQESCVYEARVAAAFNLPMISYFCPHYEVSNKYLYPTFARTKPTDQQISKSVASLLKHFNWNKVVIIANRSMQKITETISELLQSNQEFSSSPEETSRQISKRSLSFETLLRKLKIEVTAARYYEGPHFHNHGDNPFAKIVQETYVDTRIYVMLSDYYEFIGLMENLQDRGLLDTGEYFVVGVYKEQYDPIDPSKYLEGIFQTSVSASSVKAFRSFLGILHSPPVYPWFNNFSVLVNDYLEAPPFNFTNPYRKYGKLKVILPEAAYLYDAVWIYARAAHKALLNNESISDGHVIFRYVNGTTYKSAMGYYNRIDRNGDAEGNFSVVARKEVPKEPGRWGLFPVGTFYLNNDTGELPEFGMYDGEAIKWIGDGPPVDEPACGFRRQFCIPAPSNTAELVGGTIGGVLLVVIIIGIIIYRNWRYEQDLASLLWKVEFRDIVIKTNVSQYANVLHGTPVNKRGFRNSIVSLNSQADLDFRQVFTEVGTYKNTIVAIKWVCKKHIDLTRTVRKELKIIRDLRHGNINPFIGACVDPGHVCVLTEYNPKGSLQDILANDDVKLDNMFIASMVFDVIKGLIYLHDCEIHHHGRLKSSNCVVDSRWVVKITDFGLNYFKLDSEEDETNEHKFYQNKLWTAPEIIRSADQLGSQKGDAYSFGIILYEIHGRRGPYGDNELTPKEIIQRVMCRSYDVPYRPKLAALDSTPKFVTDVIKDCWDEDPNVRPDFKTIRHRLKAMQKGMKSNIFDNMMAIMEKYATNLEAIVDERTEQLKEEKKKTEELLHQMLPRSVAEQLKQGKQVEAESFDSVTIYFSDICGFTALSSESTPMQVVDLLNDLYTTFDSIIGNYDVYKVETIGDAYMVVSGLPKPNGIKHAGEIASMSLHLLANIKKFTIRHRPDTMLKLRIGIHSGSCVAGVVGLKMPRYCLFGDTVNTTSRMESNGLPLKIHCSTQSYDLLMKLGGYQLEERGFVFMKGKGDVRTYWLHGEDKERRLSRLASVNNDDVTDVKQTKSCLKPSLSNMSERSETDSCILPNGPAHKQSIRNRVTMFDDASTAGQKDGSDIFVWPTNDNCSVHERNFSIMNRADSIDTPNIESQNNCMESGEYNPMDESVMGKRNRTFLPEITPLIEKSIINGKLKAKRAVSVDACV